MSARLHQYSAGAAGGEDGGGSHRDGYQGQPLPPTAEQYEFRGAGGAG
jgi:hypothetical protein